MRDVVIVRLVKAPLLLTSPVGRSRRIALGEGVGWQLARNTLAPALSEWEREQQWSYLL